MPYRAADDFCCLLGFSFFFSFCVWKKDFYKLVIELGALG